MMTESSSDRTVTMLLGGEHCPAWLL